MEEDTAEPCWLSRNGYHLHHPLFYPSHKLECQSGKKIKVAMKDSTGTDRRYLDMSYAKVSKWNTPLNTLSEAQIIIKAKPHNE
jgi:hypothetical protein